MALEEIEQAVIALGVTPSGSSAGGVKDGLLLNTLIFKKTDIPSLHFLFLRIGGGEGGALPVKFLPVVLNGRVLGGATKEVRGIMCSYLQILFHYMAPPLEHRVFILPLT